MKKLLFLTLLMVGHAAAQVDLKDPILTNLSASGGSPVAFPVFDVDPTLAAGAPIRFAASLAAYQAMLNVEDGATADQTGAEIKVAYEAEADTNAFDDAAVAKLAGIEALADVTDETNVTDALDGATLVDLGTPAAGDLVLLQDADAANVLKVAQFSEFGGGGGGGGDLWSDPVDAVITPDANGTRDLATTTTRFATGFFDDVDVTNDITSTQLLADNLIYTEQASIAALSPGEGAFYVRNDIPNVPVYKDDTNAVLDITLNTKTQTLTNKTLDSGSNSILIHDEEHTGAGPHTLTASDCHNGVHYVTAASTVNLPAIADGMSLTIISEIAGTVVINPDGTEVIRLDGTDAAAGENIESPSAVGDMVTLTYRAAGTWYAATNGWTEETP